MARWSMRGVGAPAAIPPAGPGRRALHLAALAWFALCTDARAVGVQGAARTTAGEVTLEEAQQAFDRAEDLRQKGQYGEALPRAERALAVREKLLGPDDTAVADACLKLFREKGYAVPA